MSALRLLLGAALGLLATAAPAGAHHAHRDLTYEVTPAARLPESARQLRLAIVDAESGRPIAARFTLTLDGAPHVPDALGLHGLRFTSRHPANDESAVVTYARGSGDIAIPLPDAAKRARVSVVKGFEYVPQEVAVELAGPTPAVEVRLRRWIDLAAEGWHAVDDHLHYARVRPEHDRDWLAMLDADGLSHAHFLVVRGGKRIGVWGRSHAYGAAGEAREGARWIRAGEEYRDHFQGHANLLGIDRIVEPIAAARGPARRRIEFPTLREVLRQARGLGGLVGPAHGGTRTPHSTALLDTVLGEVDFFEIANTGHYDVELWYLLMNAGYVVAPLAGTDLPNQTQRTPEQPFLGEVRAYVRVGASTGFDAWKRAVRRGETFVSGGPLIRLDVAGAGPGGELRLPAEGGTVAVAAELASPRPLRGLEIVSAGEAVAAAAPGLSVGEDGIHRLRVQDSIEVRESGWIAARGAERGGGIAHTAAVRVIVGDRPIGSPEHVAEVRERLEGELAYYANEMTYATPEQKRRYVEAFREGLRRLSQRGASGPNPGEADRVSRR